MILSPREIKLVLRTLLRPSDSIRPTDFRFCFVVPAQLPNPLRVLSKTQPGWIMNIPAVGLIGSPPIILAIGHWLWVIGYGLGGAASPLFMPLASNLSPYRLIVHHLYALISLPAKGSVLTQMPQADAWAVRSSASQNHWLVRQNIINSTEGR